MKRNGIGFGLFLIFIGIIAIMFLYGYLDYRIFFFLIRNMPLVISMLLIVNGINLILNKYYFVKFITWTAFFAVLLTYGYYNHQNIKNSNPQRTVSTEDHFEELSPNTKKGKLDVSLGALNFEIGSTDVNLYEGSSTGVGIKHQLSYENDKETAVANLDETGKDIFSIISDFFSKGEIVREAKVNLNDDIVWDMNIELDAAQSVLDMSKLNVEKVDINFNAGDFKMIFGDKHDYTKVDADINAGSAKISVPKAAGIKLKVDSSLSLNDFQDITMEKLDGYYISPNYKEAECKIEMNIDFTAGNLKIIGVD